MSTLFREGSLGSILHGSRIITEEDIAAALLEQQRSGLRFGEALVRLGIVQQEDIDWALAHQLDIPFVRLRMETVDPDAVRLVPASIARKFALMPIIRIGDELRIAVADPTNGIAVDEVARITGCSVAISMGLLREIRELQTIFYGEPEEIARAGFSSGCFDDAVQARINADATGAGLLEHLLEYLFRNRLFSNSVRSGEGGAAITGRSGATSRRIGELAPGLFREFLALIRNRAGLSGTAGSSTGTLPTERNGAKVPVRVVLTPTATGEYLTLKRACGAEFPETLAALGTSEQNLGTIRDLAALPDGLVLVAAADPAVRSRFMGAVLREFDGLEKDLLAIGSGFSFCADRFPLLPDAGQDGATGRLLRAAIAHEPHVVALEELSDVPAFDASLDAVRSGMLLFGGVTVPGIRAMLRQLMFLRDRFPFLPLYVRGLIACREVQLLCPDCRQEGSPPDEPPVSASAPRHWTGSAEGCSSCGGTGYEGRRFLVEAVRFEGGLRDILNRSEDLAACLDYLQAQGFHGIVEEAAELLAAGGIPALEYAAICTELGVRQWPE